MKLNRRVAIVTGAATGIGEASARLFARQGARLVLADVDRVRLAALAGELEASSTIVVEVCGDVSNAETCREIVARTAGQFGRLDVLFNCAGVVLSGTLPDCTEEDWQRTMDVNLKSVYMLCRHAVPVMQRQGGGIIINMASVAGVSGLPDYGVYSISQGGLVALTKSLALDFAGDGIRANCICAGTVDTPSFRQRIASAPDPAQALRAAVARQPGGRLTSADEIAAAALFLASDESRSMTGQAVVIDGGMKLQRARLQGREP